MSLVSEEFPEEVPLWAEEVISVDQLMSSQRGFHHTL
jgi:hypothetical protein